MVASGYGRNTELEHRGLFDYTHKAAMEDILVLGQKQINAGSDELDALTDAVPQVTCLLGRKP